MNIATAPNVFNAEAAARQAAIQKMVIDDFLRANPSIGIKMVDGRPMYYRTTNYATGAIIESRDPRKVV
jgi:hypothetical protein